MHVKKLVHKVCACACVVSPKGSNGWIGVELFVSNAGTPLYSFEKGRHTPKF